MLRYASSGSICRNQFLLSYFGQLDSPRCGRCDICLSDKEIKTDSSEPGKIRELITAILSERERSLEELVSASGGDTDRVIGVIEKLVEEGIVTREKDLVFKLKHPPG